MRKPSRPRPEPRTLDIDDELFKEWDGLADRMGAPPFQRPSYVAAWWASFGSGRARILQSRRDGRLCGVLPISESFGVVEGMTNDHQVIHGPLAENAGALDDLLAEAAGRARWHAGFGELRPDDATAMLEVARRGGLPARSALVGHAPFITIDRSFAEHCARVEKRHLRQVERNRRRLSTVGRLEFVVHEDPTLARDAMDEAFRVESMGWKGEQGTGILSSEATRRFYRSVGEWAASRGELRIGLLTLDGRAIASDFSLEDGRSHYMLKTGYDPEHRANAPGLILRHDMIEHCFGRSLRTYELTGHAEAYKLRWTDETREIRRVVLHPRSAAGRAAHVTEATYYERVRPALVPLARRLRHAVARLRSR